MVDVNRVSWGVIFFLGVAIFLWLEWQDATWSAMGWFILTGFWSAVCGIGYTVAHWIIKK